MSNLNFSDDFFESAEGEDRGAMFENKCKRLGSIFKRVPHTKKDRIRLVFVCLRLFIAYKDIVYENPRTMSAILQKFEEIEDVYEKLTTPQKELYHTTKNIFGRS